jgi:transcriptional regulator with XRE-family HTH domain
MLKGLMFKSKSGQVLSDFIQARKQPRNQVATLSGLTNTYIRNLENGEIANVPRERLIAIGLALNLDLSEIDTLLFAFDRANLTEKDIPAFIQMGKEARLSEAVLPIRNFSLLELIVFSMEQVQGHLVIVSDRPTASLMDQGHRTHRDSQILSRHPIYKDLNEAIGITRKKNFFSLLENHKIDHYICRQCLEEYINAKVDETERSFRYRHLKALIRTLEKEDGFNLYLTHACANLLFTLKLTDPGKGNDKISYSANAPHSLYRGKRGRLMGFITENQVLCECFKEELKQVAQTVMPETADKKSQIEYLSSLLAASEPRL